MSPDRSRPLLAVLLLLTAGGVAMTPRAEGAAPAPCAQPGVVDRVLRCDGAGEDPGTFALLAGQKIDINRAGESALRVVPGVGRRLAAAIVEHRRGLGRFSRWSDVRAVTGVGEKTLAKIQRYFVIRAR